MSGHRKEALVFNERFGRHSYGPNHPLKVERLRLTMDLIEAYGVFDTPRYHGWKPGTFPFTLSPCPCLTAGTLIHLYA